MIAKNETMFQAPSISRLKIAAISSCGLLYLDVRATFDLLGYDGPGAIAFKAANVRIYGHP